MLRRGSKKKKQLQDWEIVCEEEKERGSRGDIEGLIEKLNHTLQSCQIQYELKGLIIVTKMFSFKSRKNLEKEKENPIE